MPKISETDAPPNEADLLSSLKETPPHHWREVASRPLASGALVIYFVCSIPGTTLCGLKTVVRQGFSDDPGDLSILDPNNLGPDTLTLAPYLPVPGPDGVYPLREEVVEEVVDTEEGEGSGEGGEAARGEGEPEAPAEPEVPAEPETASKPEVPAEPETASKPKKGK